VSPLCSGTPSSSSSWQRRTSSTAWCRLGSGSRGGRCSSAASSSCVYIDIVLSGSISVCCRRGRAAESGRTRRSRRPLGGAGRKGEPSGRGPAVCAASASFSSPSPPLAATRLRCRAVVVLGCEQHALPGRGATGPDVTRVAAGRRVREAGGTTRGGGGGVGQVQNWKMATEGGGRHSPSTVVWEEEGVLGIVQPTSPNSVEPKVMDSAPTALFPGQMNVRPDAYATRGGVS